MYEKLIRKAKYAIANKIYCNAVERDWLKFKLGNNIKLKLIKVNNKEVLFEHSDEKTKVSCVIIPNSEQFDLALYETKDDIHNMEYEEIPTDFNLYSEKYINGSLRRKIEHLMHDYGIITVNHSKIEKVIEELHKGKFERYDNLESKIETILGCIVINQVDIPKKNEIVNTIKFITEKLGVSLYINFVSGNTLETFTAGTETLDETEKNELLQSGLQGNYIDGFDRVFEELSFKGEFENGTPKEFLIDAANQLVEKLNGIPEIRTKLKDIYKREINEIILENDEFLYDLCKESVELEKIVKETFID